MDSRGLKRFALVSAFIFPLVYVAGAAVPFAQMSFPDKSKTISVIVPYPPGGGTDIAARVMTALLEKEVGVPVIVLNKAGAGGQIGFTELARSKPDGYTMGMLVIPTAITTYLDPERKALFSRKSFELLAVQDQDPGIMAVKADSPYKTMKDLIDAAKAKPQSIRACTAGILSDDHMAIMMAEQLGGVKFAVVHFDGVVPGRTAVLGGHVEAFFGNASELRSQVSGGSMRILSVFDKKRSRYYPDVKTAEEQGFPMYSGVYHGVGMPAGAPREIRDYLAAALKRVATSDEFKQRMEKMSYEPLYMDPDQYSAFWSEYEAGAKKWVERGK
ncbi:MAG TPA: tripartite tricarboxylate transporter substrate binding protein [Thermodesulfobacteriota bacterium]|nr:tripartite tricarboxylate transporter substrate binding protein [Thermodesulfobacteriota bacterium]